MSLEDASVMRIKSWNRNGQTGGVFLRNGHQMYRPEKDVMSGARTVNGSSGNDQIFNV